jgi:hypothetical protein
MTDLRAMLVTTVEYLTDPNYGPYVAALIGEAQRDSAFARTLLRRWTWPRRAAIRERLRRAQAQGQLRTELDLDTVVDLVFGPVFYRLLLGTGPLSGEFAADICELVLTSLGAPDGRRLRRAAADGDVSPRR